MSTPVPGGALDGPAGTDRHLAEALGGYGNAPSGDLGVDSIAPPREAKRA
jgi:hypothetical protein